MISDGKLRQRLTRRVIRSSPRSRSMGLCSSKKLKEQVSDPQELRGKFSSPPPGCCPPPLCELQWSGCFVEIRGIGSFVYFVLCLPMLMMSENTGSLCMFWHFHKRDGYVSKRVTDSVSNARATSDVQNRASVTLSQWFHLFTLNRSVSSLYTLKIRSLLLTIYGSLRWNSRFSELSQSLSGLMMPM